MTRHYARTAAIATALAVMVSSSLPTGLAYVCQLTGAVMVDACCCDDGDISEEAPGLQAADCCGIAERSGLDEVTSPEPHLRPMPALTLLASILPEPDRRVRARSPMSAAAPRGPPQPLFLRNSSLLI